MPENTHSRKSHEVSTAIIQRNDGSCRRILKQRCDKGPNGEQVVTVLHDKFYLPGTIVNPETLAIVTGPGEAIRWTQAYTFRELTEIALANIKAKITG